VAKHPRYSTFEALAIAAGATVTASHTFGITGDVIGITVRGQDDAAPAAGSTSPSANLDMIRIQIVRSDNTAIMNVPTIASCFAGDGTHPYTSLPDVAGEFRVAENTTVTVQIINDNAVIILDRVHVTFIIANELPSIA
jgi:hypothetical protein